MAESMINSDERSAGFRILLDAMLAGTGTKTLVETYRALIDSARPEDLVHVVDSAVADEVDLETLKGAVSKLINLLSVSLVRYRHVPPKGERLFSSLLAENESMRHLLESGKQLVLRLNGSFSGSEPDADADAHRVLALAAVRRLQEELAAVDMHYKKLENVLFPWFERRYPQFRCVRLLWAIHDDARNGLRGVAALLSADIPLGAEKFGTELASINKMLGKLYFDLSTNAFREECALFPVMANFLTPDEGEALFDETLSYGFAFSPEELRKRFTGIPANEAAAFYCKMSGTIRTIVPAAKVSTEPFRGFAGRTGALGNDVLSAMFSAIPLDMTFVDADDKVAWFSDSPHRIFARSPAIIGRDVRNCHPGASVGRVMAILEAFKRGEKDSEAFWLEMGCKFIHIEYFALRSPQGAYLGTLECSQDLTSRRNLAGEKRL